MCTWSIINLQDANSPIIENLIFFHDHTIIIIYIITIIILYIIYNLINNKINNKLILENQIIEIAWTIIPIFALIFIAIPSLSNLYLNDEVSDPLITVKSIGHQWYWRFEYSDFINNSLESFISKENPINNFRLLDVDNKAIIPFDNPIRLLTTSDDVIHSWTIPRLGIKIDSIPGRINQAILYITRPGTFFGQCSEVCGVNHRFIPISIEGTSIDDFISWIENLNLNNKDNIINLNHTFIEKLDLINSLINQNLYSIDSLTQDRYNLILKFLKIILEFLTNYKNFLYSILETKEIIINSSYLYINDPISTTIFNDKYEVINIYSKIYNTRAETIHTQPEPHVPENDPPSPVQPAPAPVLLGWDELGEEVPIFLIPNPNFLPYEDNPGAGVEVINPEQANQPPSPPSPADNQPEEDPAPINDAPVPEGNPIPDPIEPVVQDPIKPIIPNLNLIEPIIPNLDLIEPYIPDLEENLIDPIIPDLEDLIDPIIPDLEDLIEPNVQVHEPNHPNQPDVQEPNPNEPDIPGPIEPDIPVQPIAPNPNEPYIPGPNDEPNEP